MIFFYTNIIRKKNTNANNAFTSWIVEKIPYSVPHYYLVTVQVPVTVLVQVRTGITY